MESDPARDRREPGAVGGALRFAAAALGLTLLACHPTPLLGAAQADYQNVEIRGTMSFVIPGLNRQSRDYTILFYESENSDNQSRIVGCNFGPKLFPWNQRWTFRTQYCRLDVLALQGREQAYAQFFYNAPLGTDPLAVPIGGGQFEWVPFGPRLRVSIRSEKKRTIIALPKP